MKSFHFSAVTYEGGIYCTKCLPHHANINSEEVHPIFADSEWDYIPTCDVCGHEHDYVTLLKEDNL